jgi:hypothetical protein
MQDLRHFALNFFKEFVKSFRFELKIYVDQGIVKKWEHLRVSINNFVYILTEKIAYYFRPFVISRPHMGS